MSPIPYILAAINVLHNAYLLSLINKPVFWDMALDLCHDTIILISDK